MKQCSQTNTQSIYDHGISVQNHILQLIKFLQTGKIDNYWKLPDWCFQYKKELLYALLPIDVIKQYTLFHDCGKPYCITYDEFGKKHFPNHAEHSYKKYLSIGGDEQVALLIKMDMDIHNLKANNI